MSLRTPAMVRLLVAAGAACALVLPAVAKAAEDAEKEPVHKRPYVHRIRLIDEKGDPIDADSTVPYSPRGTCGKCHKYETISRGMHFDMGASLLSDDFAKEQGKPWILSPGMVGGYLPSFRRQYARKTNASGKEIDLTAYEFVRACGPCHPGGGALEHDRDGKRYDAHMKERKDAGDDLAASLDGDYHKAKWHRSGVVEIDCLLCHAQWPYNVEERTRQLRAENYRYAATAAAGFGLIRGDVASAGDEEEDDPADPGASSDEPAVSVQYDKRLFDGQSHVTLDIAMPRDRACLSCHHFPARAGTAGRDRRHWRDVHTAQGLACVRCHSGGLDHNFELGRALHWSAKRATPSEPAEPGKAPATPGTEAPGARAASADSPGERPRVAVGAPATGRLSPWPMSCEGCHDHGHLGAPTAPHPGLPRLHLERIACVACHVGPALDAVGSEAVVYADPAPSTPEGAGLTVPYPDQQGRWQIWYLRAGGQIRVYHCQTPYLWGNLMVCGSAPDAPEVVWPYFEREMAAAWAKVRDKINDDDGDGTPEVNTRDEIRTLTAALHAVLEGGRFAEVTPAHVQGDTLFYVKEDEVARHEDDPLTAPTTVPLGHVVLGPRQALGAGGCTDCHARDHYFFDGDRVTSFLSLYGYPRRLSMRRGMDYPSRGVRYSALREGFLKPYGLLLVPLAVLLCLLHYVVFRPKIVRGDDPDDTLERFGVFERVVHLVQLLAFLFLAASGCCFIFHSLWGSAMPACLTGHAAEWLHSLVGYVLIGTTVLLLVRWLPAAAFRPYDATWLKCMGGYLWLKGEAPAGKFNAGQKILFWLVVVLGLVLGLSGILMALDPPQVRGYLTLSYLLHNLAAMLLLPLVIGHVYLGSICNPGTLRAIFEGRVTRAWARKHHPNWLDELEGRDAGPAEQNEERAGEDGPSEAPQS